MSRVELFEEIRRDHRQGVSIRGLAEDHGVHRRTMRQAISDAVPPVRKTPERVAPVLGPWKETIRGWLTDDLVVPKKQRHTARRVWERLVAEHGVQVAESTVRRFVAVVRAELTSGSLMAAGPQTHGLGAEAEVDFGEFYVWLDGTWTRLWMFVMRLSASGKAFHHAQVQGVVATLPCSRERRCSSRAPAGVLHSRVFRGRLLSVAATASRSSRLCLLRSVPLGKYWRNRPLVFSLVPRCHGNCGSQK